MKKFEVHYSYYLSDSVEIEAESEEEAKEKCREMISKCEIGNLNEMTVCDSRVWID